MPPLALEEGVIRRIVERHGGAAWDAVRKILTEPDYHAHAAEARLAARTLALRHAPNEVGAYFRDLFKKAKAGDQLCDAAEANERLRIAELANLLPPPNTDLAGLIEARDELDARHAAVIVGGDAARAELLEAALGQLDARIGERRRREQTPSQKQAPPPRETLPVLAIDELAVAFGDLAASLRARGEQKT